MKRNKSPENKETSSSQLSRFLEKMRWFLVSKFLADNQQKENSQLPGFLEKMRWLLEKFLANKQLKEKIKQRQITISIPTKYAQLEGGNTILGLELYHNEQKGTTSINISRSKNKIKQQTAQYTLRVWIYITENQSVGYLESVEIEGQPTCFWQHNVWSLDENGKFKSKKEEQHSIPHVSHGVFKGIILERFGVSFENHAQTAINNFLRN